MNFEGSKFWSRIGNRTFLVLLSGSLMCAGLAAQPCQYVPSGGQPPHGVQTLFRFCTDRTSAQHATPFLNFSSTVTNGTQDVDENATDCGVLTPYNCDWMSIPVNPTITGSNTVGSILHERGTLNGFDFYKKTLLTPAANPNAAMTATIVVAPSRGGQSDAFDTMWNRSPPRDPDPNFQVVTVAIYEKYGFRPVAESMVGLYLMLRHLSSSHSFVTFEGGSYGGIIPFLAYMIYDQYHPGLVAGIDGGGSGFSAPDRLAYARLIEQDWTSSQERFAANPTFDLVSTLFAQGTQAFGLANGTFDFRDYSSMPGENFPIPVRLRLSDSDPNYVAGPGLISLRDDYIALGVDDSRQLIKLPGFAHSDQPDATEELVQRTLLFNRIWNNTLSPTTLATIPPTGADREYSSIRNPVFPGPGQGSSIAFQNERYYEETLGTAAGSVEARALLPDGSWVVGNLEGTLARYNFDGTTSSIQRLWRTDNGKYPIYDVMAAQLNGQNRILAGAQNGLYIYSEQGDLLLHYQADEAKAISVGQVTPNPSGDEIIFNSSTALLEVISESGASLVKQPLGGFRHSVVHQDAALGETRVCTSMDLGYVACFVIVDEGGVLVPVATVISEGFFYSPRSFLVIGNHAVVGGSSYVDISNASAAVIDLLTGSKVNDIPLPAVPAQSAAALGSMGGNAIFLALADGIYTMSDYLNPSTLSASPLIPVGSARSLYGPIRGPANDFLLVRDKNIAIYDSNGSPQASLSIPRASFALTAYDSNGQPRVANLRGSMLKEYDVVTGALQSSSAATSAFQSRRAVRLEHIKTQAGQDILLPCMTPSCELKEVPSLGVSVFYQQQCGLVPFAILPSPSLPINVTALQMDLENRAASWNLGIGNAVSVCEEAETGQAQGSLPQAGDPLPPFTYSTSLLTYSPQVSFASHAPKSLVFIGGDMEATSWDSALADSDQTAANDPDAVLLVATNKGLWANKINSFQLIANTALGVQPSFDIADIDGDGRSDVVHVSQYPAEDGSVLRILDEALDVFLSSDEPQFPTGVIAQRVTLNGGQEFPLIIAATLRGQIFAYTVQGASLVLLASHSLRGYNAGRNDSIALVSANQTDPTTGDPLHHLVVGTSVGPAVLDINLEHVFLPVTDPSQLAMTEVVGGGCDASGQEAVLEIPVLQMIPGVTRNLEIRGRNFLPNSTVSLIQTPGHVPLIPIPTGGPNCTAAVDATSSQIVAQALTDAQGDWVIQLPLTYDPSAVGAQASYVAIDVNQNSRISNSALVQVGY